MMKRREFLKSVLGGTVGAVAVLATVRCQSNEAPDMPGSRTFTGSSSQGHTHTVTIQRSEVENPPVGGISRSTSSSSGHSHTFAMTQAQLQSVNAGNTVPVTDSLVSGHTHDYVIQKWF
ncbi:MAG: hypothetical protein AB1715_03695 [Acidobacteriota bacterium]